MAIESWKLKILKVLEKDINKCGKVRSLNNITTRLYKVILMGKFGGHRLKNKLVYVHRYDRTFKGGIAICEGPIAYLM